LPESIQFKFETSWFWQN